MLGWFEDGDGYAARDKLEAPSGLGLSRPELARHAQRLTTNLSFT